MNMDHDISAKFCNVVPIRYGLILWAFMKVFAALAALWYILCGIHIVFFENGIKYNPVMLGIMVILAIALVVDLSMSVLLILGEYKKKYKPVTAYFHYAIYMVITFIIIIAVYTTYELALLWTGVDSAPWHTFRTFKLRDVIKLATMGTVYVLFEVYIVYLLRIEVVALRSQWKLKCRDDLSVTESYLEA